MNDTESPFRKALMIELSKLPDVQIHRQNSGEVIFRRAKSSAIGRFAAGPPAGAADISGVALLSAELEIGARLEIETKSSTGKLREAQKNWAARQTALGAIYVHATAAPELNDEQNAQGWARVVWNEIERRRERLAALLKGTR
jgi:hypothetical protein